MPLHPWGCNIPSDSSHLGTAAINLAFRKLYRFPWRSHSPGPLCVESFVPLYRERKLLTKIISKCNGQQQASPTLRQEEEKRGRNSAVIRNPVVYVTGTSGYVLENTVHWEQLTKPPYNCVSSTSKILYVQGKQDSSVNA